MARNYGRYLAPITLVAVIVATILVVSSGLGHSNEAPPTQHAHAVLSVHAPPRKLYYVIQAGDSLSTISVKTGVPVPTLEALNPSIDPNTLQTGARLRLRR